MLATCASSYARLSEVFPGLRVSSASTARGAGWVTAAELARGGAGVDAYVERSMAAFAAGGTGRAAGTRARPPRPDVAAALALHRYLWPACLLFTVPWFLQRRVPRLPVGRVAFHPATGHFAVAPREVVCLTGDPAARAGGTRGTAGLARMAGRAGGQGHGLRAVPDEAALRDELRSALTAHLAPVLAGFAPRLRRGPHALWRTATDEIAEGLRHIGQLLGAPARASRELAALLPGGTPPFAAAASCDGPTRTRLTCCLFYTMSPGDPCSGCPRRTGAAEIRRPAHTG